MFGSMKKKMSKSAAPTKTNPAGSASAQCKAGGCSDGTPEGGMTENYTLAAEIVKDRLVAENAAYAGIMESVSEADVCVVDGCYDHIHAILSKSNMPFLRLPGPEGLVGATFRPDQTMYINCGDQQYSPGQLEAVRSFVAQGGLLVTTDWALKNVLEGAFPGYVRWNKKTSGDECVSVKVVQKDEMLLGFMDEATDPVWWLESSSYPIEIVDKDKVEVLMHSDELQARLGEGAVVVKFKYGEGEVYHMISHFYLQKSETRAANKNLTVDDYVSAKWKGGQAAKKSAMLSGAAQRGGGAVNYSAVQSAVTSSELVHRSVLKQKTKAASWRRPEE